MGECTIWHRRKPLSYSLDISVIEGRELFTYKSEDVLYRWTCAGHGSSAPDARSPGPGPGSKNQFLRNQLHYEATTSKKNSFEARSLKQQASPKKKG